MFVAIVGGICGSRCVFGKPAPGKIVLARLGRSIVIMIVACPVVFCDLVDGRAAPHETRGLWHGIRGAVAVVVAMLTTVVGVRLNI